MPGNVFITVVILLEFFNTNFKYVQELSFSNTSESFSALNCLKYLGSGVAPGEG